MKVHNSFQSRQSTFLWSLTHFETISLVTYLEQDPDIVTLVLPQKRIKQSFLSVFRKLPYHHKLLRIVSPKQLLLLLMFAPENICPTVFQKTFLNAEQFHNFVIILTYFFIYSFIQYIPTTASFPFYTSKFLHSPPCPHPPLPLPSPPPMSAPRKCRPPKDISQTHHNKIQ